MASWFDQANTGTSGDMSGFLSNMFRGNDMNWGGLASGLTGLYGGLQGMSTANNVNNQVQSGLNQHNSATQAQIDALQSQIAQNRQQAQDMYQRSLGDVTAQNQGLNSDIATNQANLAALSDPNSPYMQQARQAIERKDAAAGRRSQWGEREVQLAAELADRVGRYSPAMQGAITQARNQINSNNQGLASLYSTANNPGDRNMLAQIQMLQQQLAGTNASNTTGRAAANSATNNMTGLLNQGAGLLGSALGGLGGLFGSGSGGGITNAWGGNTGLGTGGWGGLGANLYGSSSGGWGFGDSGLGTGMGFTGGGLGGGYFDLGGTGSLGSGLDFQSGGLGQGLQGFGQAWGSDQGLFNDEIW